MKVTAPSSTSNQMMYKRNPFVVHAKQRKADAEKPKRGRGSYTRKPKHKIDIEVWYEKNYPCKSTRYQS